ncbi:winged helix-turn-helix domain-containing protein [bacterium]|nr:winged helix-turn-helix domain-containing protein [bacterium]
MENSIGTAAGNVWKYLSENGATQLSTLKKELDLNGAMIDRAIGWLAREGKLIEEKKGRSISLSLKE